ncbi:hypothetical protein EOD39_12709 [Acipenser ruthenus]|uniref:Uncharacterized protein n=1 Tax=Acipenser ruthenus TaxID=7906 RepID=A0A662YQ73_ACIRT|nr:hypothetical protein EOD39_12709 [Acipenser ruthenus]
MAGHHGSLSTGDPVLWTDASGCWCFSSSGSLLVAAATQAPLLLFLALEADQVQGEQTSQASKGPQVMRALLPYLGLLLEGQAIKGQQHPNICGGREPVVAPALPQKPLGIWLREWGVARPWEIPARVR